MSDNNIIKNAEAVLNSQDALKQFAELNRLSAEAAKTLLERLLKEPEVSKKAQEYIFSSERSDDLKGYRSGEEHGYVRGHEAGFAKGATVGALGALGLMTVAGLIFLLRK